MKKFVITSDKYSFCLGGLQRLIKKYWKEDNLEITILGFNTPNVELLEGFSFQSLGDNLNDSTPWKDEIGRAHV